MWTEIDLKGPWLDLTNEEELSAAAKRTISIPPEAKPNYRVFNYVFSEKKHHLYVESLNEFGQRLGPHTARSIFTRLLSQELHGFKSPEVEVTVIPQEGAVDRILALPQLRKLLIRITLPNPDVASPAARKRIFAQLQAANARQLEQVYVKAAEADRLTPTTEIRETADVAAENGFVRGEGRTLNGENVELATDRDPWRISIPPERSGSFLSRLLGTLRSL